MNRFEKIIKKAIKKTMEDLSYHFEKWWNDDFPCDLWYENINELDDDDFEIVQSDWIAENINKFVAYACEKLGIDTESIENKEHTELVEEIYDDVKDELREHLTR